MLEYAFTSRSYTRPQTKEEKPSRSVPVVGMLTVEVTDDWLDELGVSLEDFTGEMMGVWYFNYSQALKHANVQSIFYFVSAKVNTTKRFVHQGTGATFVVLPPPKLYALFRRWLPRPPSLMPWRFQLRLLTGLRHAIYRSIRFILRYFSTPLTRLFCELKKDGCEALVVQEYESARFDLCVILGRIKRIPVFGTYQGGVPQHVFLRPLRSLAMKLCAGLLVPARNEARRVLTDYTFSKPRLTLIYTPVNTALFQPLRKGEGRVDLGIDGNAQVVIYHGQILFDYKGLDVLLQAWERISQLYSNVCLVIVGTGRDAAELSARLATKKDLKVRWINQWIRDQREIRRYLASANIYVCPSRGDAFPLATLEAMACGLPVVASNVNGITDILKDGEQSGGVLVTPGDVNALFEALARLLKNRALTQLLGRRARTRAMTEFSMERAAPLLKHTLLGEKTFYETTA